MACRGARLLSMLLLSMLLPPVCLTLRAKEQLDLAAVTPNASALPGAQNVTKHVSSSFCQPEEQREPDPGLVCTLGGGGARALVVDVGIFKGLRETPAWPKKVLAISGAAWFATILTYAKDADGNFIGFDDLLGKLGELDFCGMTGKTAEQQPLEFHKCKALLSALRSTDYQKSSIIGLGASLTRSAWASSVHALYFEKFGIKAAAVNEKNPDAPDMYALVASLHEHTGLGGRRESFSIQAHGFDTVIGDGSNDMCVEQTRGMLWPSQLQSMKKIMKKAAPAIGTGGEYVGVAESAALSSYVYGLILDSTGGLFQSRLDGLMKSRFDLTGAGGVRKGGYFLRSMRETPSGALAHDHPPMSYYTMSDSGNVESTGVPTALAMGHNRIFSVLNSLGNVNPESALQCHGKDLLRCYRKWIGPALLMLFFKHDKSWLGDLLYLQHYNHVFDGAAFPRLLRSLQASIEGGNGAVATLSVNTIENAHFHIEAGREVNITFVVMFDGISGKAALPGGWLSEPETAKQLEVVGTVAETRKWKHVTALIDGMKEGKVSGSSLWKPTVLDLQMTKPQLVCAWLFSEMVAWVTKQAANALE